jgi:hypothetical protein
MLHCRSRRRRWTRPRTGSSTCRSALGFGRVVVSEIDAPNLLGIPRESGGKWLSGSAKRPNPSPPAARVAVDALWRTSPLCERAPIVAGRLGSTWLLARAPTVRCSWRRRMNHRSPSPRQPSQRPSRCVEVLSDARQNRPIVTRAHVPRQEPSPIYQVSPLLEEESDSEDSEDEEDEDVKELDRKIAALEALEVPRPLSPLLLPHPLFFLPLSFLCLATPSSLPCSLSSLLPPPPISLPNPRQSTFERFPAAVATGAPFSGARSTGLPQRRRCETDRDI